MINFKVLLASLLVAGVSAQTTFAQVASEKKKSGYPYAFVGVQGGGQVTFGNYDATKLITPIGAVNIGGMFTPVVGARLHVSGINEKGGLKSLDKTYKYKFVTSNLDLMFNLCNAFAPNKHHVVNAYLLGGVGLGYAWDNDDLNKLAGNNITSVTNDNVNLRWSDDRLVHNFRVGAMLDFELSRLVGINLEVTANNYHDRFNSKLMVRAIGKCKHWQVSTLSLAANALLKIMPIWSLNKTTTKCSKLNRLPLLNQSLSLSQNQSPQRVCCTKQRQKCSLPLVLLLLQERRKLNFVLSHNG